MARVSGMGGWPAKAIYSLYDIQINETILIYQNQEWIDLVFRFVNKQSPVKIFDLLKVKLS